MEELEHRVGFCLWKPIIRVKGKCMKCEGYEYTCEFYNPSFRRYKTCSEIKDIFIKLVDYQE